MGKYRVVFMICAYYKSEFVFIRTPLFSHNQWENKNDSNIWNALLHMPPKFFFFAGNFISVIRFVFLLWVTKWFHLRNKTKNGNVTTAKLKWHKFSMHNVLLSLSFCLEQMTYHYISTEISFRRSELYHNPPVIKAPYIFKYYTTYRTEIISLVECFVYIRKQIHAAQHSFSFLASVVMVNRFYWN